MHRAPRHVLMMTVPSLAVAVLGLATGALGSPTGHLQRVGAGAVTLSNTKLPLDQHGNKIITGEA